MIEIKKSGHASAGLVATGRVQQPWNTQKQVYKENSF